MSRDEIFLTKFYEFALAKGDPKTPMRFQEIAAKIGHKPVETINVVKLLAKANMIIKHDDEIISLTDRGCKLAKSCL